jgi:hypothetical protein
LTAVDHWQLFHEWYYMLYSSHVIVPVLFFHSLLGAPSTVMFLVFST